MLLFDSLQKSFKYDLKVQQRSNLIRRDFGYDFTIILNT